MNFEIGKPFAMKSGDNVILRNTTDQTFHMLLKFGDGAKVRCLVIPGHCAEVVVGTTSVDVEFLEGGEDLVGTPGSE